MSEIPFRTPSILASLLTKTNSRYPLLLFLVSSVTIKKHIKTIVDLDNPNFKTWKEHMKVIIGRFNHTSHLDGSPPFNNSVLQRIDYVILLWIYSTISPTVLRIIYKPNSSAHDARKSIEMLDHDM